MAERVVVHNPGDRVIFKRGCADDALLTGTILSADGDMGAYYALFRVRTDGSDEISLRYRDEFITLGELADWLGD